MRNTFSDPATATAPTRPAASVKTPTRSKAKTPANDGSYAGGKAGSGVYQKIINLMPPHRVYIEAFLGGGAIMRTKRPAGANIGIEIDLAVVRAHWKAGLKHVIHGNAVDLLPDLIRAHRYVAGHVLVYCDPPYLMSVRSSKQRIYPHEFHSEKEHSELLTILRGLPCCMVMISGYDSPLYNEILHDWRKVQFTGVSRGGPRIETVWLNFPEPKELHDYRFLGETRRQRQDIKRQQLRWKNKLENMPSQKRFALLSAIDAYRNDRDGGNADNRSTEGENAAPSSSRQNRRRMITTSTSGETADTRETADLPSLQRRRKSRRDIEL